MLGRITQCGGRVTVISEDGTVYAELNYGADNKKELVKITVDQLSVVIRYPWDMLTLNELIIANFRHDGKNHRSMIADELFDTGRHKLGVIMGDYVHTGIHTSIYPGCKIWSDASTIPSAIVH